MVAVDLSYPVAKKEGLWYPVEKRGVSSRKKQAQKNNGFYTVVS